MDHDVRSALSSIAAELDGIVRATASRADDKITDMELGRIKGLAHEIENMASNIKDEETRSRLLEIVKLLAAAIFGVVIKEVIGHILGI